MTVTAAWALSSKRWLRAGRLPSLSIVSCAAKVSDWGRGNGDGCIKEYEVDRSRVKGGKRGKLRRLAVEDRTLHLEVEKTLSGDEARVEAERCLSCGRAAEVNRTCWYCLPCEIECPVNALEVRMPYLVR